VVSVYKKGDRTSPTNYRPISLTCIPCKIFEHIVYSHIFKHLTAHNILADNQHRFRKHHSCNSQLLSTIEDYSLHLDSGAQIDAIFLDFSKAFDKVPHEHLSCHSMESKVHYCLGLKICWPAKCNGWYWITSLASP